MAHQRSRLASDVIDSPNSKRKIALEQMLHPGELDCKASISVPPGKGIVQLVEYMVLAQCLT